MPSRKQSSDKPDRSLEHRHLAVDIELEVPIHPIDAVVELLVEAHHPESIERFDEREAEMMVLEREAFDPAADWLDLVLAAGAFAIVAPRPTHLPSNVLAERMPILRSRLSKSGTR